jgi:hypothetical protein
LRRTRDHASGAGLSASIRNGVGASDKLRLVLPNTTLSAVVHAIVLQVKRSGVTIQKHLPTARDRRMAGGCLAQKKKTGDQGAFRVRCEAVSQMQNEVGKGEQIGASRLWDSGCALCFPVGDASVDGEAGSSWGEAIWRTDCRRWPRFSYLWCPD